MTTVTGMEQDRTVILATVVGFLAVLIQKNYSHILNKKVSPHVQKMKNPSAQVSYSATESSKTSNLQLGFVIYGLTNMLTGNASLRTSQKTCFTLSFAYTFEFDDDTVFFACL